MRQHGPLALALALVTEEMPVVTINAGKSDAVGLHVGAAG
jgi:hypothetical protein